MTFWLGLLAAVPLSIAANLITPIISSRFARFSANRRNRLRKHSQRETQFAAWLADNPSALTAHLINQRTRQTHLVVAVALSFGLYFYFSLGSPPDAVSFVGAILSMVVALAGTLTISRNLNRTARIWDAVLKRNQWITWDMARWSTDINRWESMFEDPAADGAASEVDNSGENASVPRELPTSSQ